MLLRVSPESIGISSKQVVKFITALEKRGLHMHSALLMRGDKLFSEAYWAPFNKDFCHRMYSQTKSYVSVAIGLLIEDGKLSLEDKIVSYFHEKIDAPLRRELREQTVRDMLTMSTANQAPSWFQSDDPDRVHHYFNNENIVFPSGMLWHYDSPGTQVLSVLVEKISGMTLFDFLYERIFRHLDAFKTAKILKTRDGSSWGDSAMICTPRDMISFGRFVMNYGTYNGKRLMNEDYLRAATTKQVDNLLSSHIGPLRHGYGYKFWCSEDGAFMFYGMGSQLTVCMPNEDLIFCCNADTQGFAEAESLILSTLFTLIRDELKDEALPEDDEAYKELLKTESTRELFAIKGHSDSPLREGISGKTYEIEDNPLGFKSFRFDFCDTGSGAFVYENQTGVHELPFFVNKNRFGKFPELGYSNEFGGMRTTDGFTYSDAVSLAWVEERKLMLSVQIIDNYFGNMSLTFAFRDDDVVLRAEKAAEDFLWNYSGTAKGKLKLS